MNVNTLHNITLLQIEKKEKQKFDVVKQELQQVKIDLDKEKKVNRKYQKTMKTIAIMIQNLGDSKNEVQILKTNSGVQHQVSAPYTDFYQV